jgi:hypothetical protein
MEVEKKLEIANKILNRHGNGYGYYSEALEFFRIYVGTKSSFYKQLLTLPNKVNPDYLSKHTFSILYGYINYTKDGLETGVSFEVQIQIDTISDYLQQATFILEDKKIHPAAACIIIGASLEEFLRSFVESENIEIDSDRRGIDEYSKKLRVQELITKQDYKDITSWAGLRNDAAHGHWEKVEDREKIIIMLSGVNLFIRAYTK